MEAYLYIYRRSLKLCKPSFTCIHEENHNKVWEKEILTKNDNKDNRNDGRLNDNTKTIREINDSTKIVAEKMRSEINDFNI